MLSGEQDLFHQQEMSMMRRLENFDIRNSGAVSKRAGTELLYVSDSQMFPATTFSLLFLFFSDETYKIFFLGVDTPIYTGTNPTGLKFAELVRARFSVISVNGEEFLRVATVTGIFTSKKDGTFNIETVVPPSNITLNNFSTFLPLPGRSAVVQNDTVYFSKYGEEFNFTLGSSPLEGYSLKGVGGFDQTVTDMQFFNNSLVLATSESLYRIEYTSLNPFAQADTVKFPKILKIYTGGVTSKTLTLIGRNLVFANSRGIYLVSPGVTENAYFQVTELTVNAKHIVSEDVGNIVEISDYFRHENIFFALRNDGIIFKCIITRNGAMFSRRVAGERKYNAMDETTRVFVTGFENKKYCELNTQYPYLNDNKKKFNFVDELNTLPQFNFLDCFVQKSKIILAEPTIVDADRFSTGTLLTVNTEYRYRDSDTKELAVFKVISKSGNVYTHDKKILTNIVIISEELRDIDITDIIASADGQEIYLSYGDIQGEKIFFRTRKVDPSDTTVRVDSFFALFGFKYDANVELFLHFPVRMEIQNLVIGSFDAMKIKFFTFSREGIKQSDEDGEQLNSLLLTNYKSKVQPTKGYYYDKIFGMEIPVGYGGCILMIGGVQDDGSAGNAKSSNSR